METCQSNLFFFFFFLFQLWDSARLFARLTTAQPLRCRFRSPQTQLEECIFVMFAFEARGDHIWAFFEVRIRHCTAVCQSRGFFFHSARFKNLVHSVAACAPWGTTFPLLHMKQFDSVSSFDILTLAYPLPTLLVEAMLGGGAVGGGHTLCFTVLASVSRFHLASFVVFP